MRVRLPEETCRRISTVAVQNARTAVSKRGWKSANQLNEMSGPGLVGIRTSARYLMHQERGIKPFIMFWVKGRTLPLGCKQGDGPHIRKGVAPGTPGYVNIPHRGRVWRDQRWRHPGIAPQHFMQDAIVAAIHSEQPTIKKDVMAALRGELR